MTVASPWCFPDPRTAASWCRARSQAAAWLAYLRVQQVEVLVECDGVVSLGRFERLVLAAFPPQGGISSEQLDAKLHLGTTLLAQVLRRLAQANLILAANEGWTVTPLGRQACAEGQHDRHERRVFAFVERPDRPPHFLALRAAAGLPAEAASFDLKLLTECISRPADWKARHGFPADVTGLVTGGPQAIALVHASWLPLFLLASDDALAGHFFTADGRLGSSPAFELGRDWREVLPQLEQPWSAEHARQAWADWCLALGLRDLHAADVVLAEGKLVVRLPREQAELARKQSDNALWALVGADNVRQFVPLDITVS